MAQGFSKFLDVAGQVTDIKKTETILPVARKTAIVTPLVTGDDLTLRTSMTSPINYDKDLSRLLHKHSTFVNENKEHVKPNYQEFCGTTSNFDKMSLLWAVYKASYDVLDSARKIKCTNNVNKCEEEFPVDIGLDDILHEDTFVIWDETKKDDEDNDVFVPFYEFKYPIAIEYGSEEDTIFYEFLTMIPSINNNNHMLGMISNDTLQYNLENIGTIFSTTQQIALVTQAARISSKSGKFETVETIDKNEILLALENAIPKSVSDDVLEKYNERFNKYMPKFYKEVACPSCGHKFNYNIDLELEFFRRSLFGRGESE